MSVRWKAFGFQRAWPNKQGSVWVENSAPNGRWEVNCSCGDDQDDCFDRHYESPRRAMIAANMHIKEYHR